jgi:Protein of unknown function (DUF3037)
MAEKRQLELYLLRFLPHALRDDFVTVGLSLLESDGGFAEVRFTHDSRMLQCVAPDVELEWFTVVENEIRSRLGSLRRRDDLIQLVHERFGSMLDVAPTKAVLTEDPVKEMELLTSMYLVPPQRGERVHQRTGRMAIVNAMETAFTDAAVLQLLQKDLNLSRHIGVGDPFRIDFGFRLGSELKMFHAVSLKTNISQTQAFELAYRYPRIKVGMDNERIQTSKTAVVDQTAALWDERTRFAVGMLQENLVRVRMVEDMAEIAGEVRQELRV